MSAPELEQVDRALAGKPLVGRITGRCADIEQRRLDYQRLLQRYWVFEQTLQTIASNTCCGSCQEAAMVALEGLRIAAHEVPTP